MSKLKLVIVKTFGLKCVQNNIALTQREVVLCVQTWICQHSKICKTKYNGIGADCVHSLSNPKYLIQNS